MNASVLWLGVSLAWSGIAAGAQEEPLRFYSGHFAVGARADRGSDLVALAGPGAARRTLDLGAWQPRFGPLDACALLEADPKGAFRTVRILGPDLEERTRFQVARDRELAVGLASLVLWPRAEHAVGTAFELEFLDRRGIRAGMAARADLVLVTVEPAGGGHWVAHSVDRLGESHVHLFEGRGVLLWEHLTHASARPTVEVTASGELSAVGVLQGDRTHSSLSWIDAGGRVLGTLVVPAFRTACFDPEGERLALGGGRTVALVSVRETRLSWTRTVGGDLALGRPLAFARDGAELRAIVTAGEEEEAATSATTLVRFRGLDLVPETLREPLPFVPPGPRPWVHELSQTEESGWQLVTKRGLWRF